MKTISTLTLALFLSTFAQAQDSHSAIQKAPMEIETPQGIQKYEWILEIKETADKNDLARLYKNKNYRVKKALKFITPRNKTKLA